MTARALLLTPKILTQSIVRQSASHPQPATKLQPKALLAARHCASHSPPLARLSSTEAAARDSVKRCQGWRAARRGHKDDAKFDILTSESRALLDLMTSDCISTPQNFRAAQETLFLSVSGDAQKCPFRLLLRFMLHERQVSGTRKHNNSSRVNCSTILDVTTHHSNAQ
ncbi:uncharacterized protein UDID_17846 [Ustilago sp. UG-2017a]|nr:uncharacterized protein UDID_17846 [Ustilago sp. UG-2017a]